MLMRDSNVTFLFKYVDLLRKIWSVCTIEGRDRNVILRVTCVYILVILNCYLAEPGLRGNKRVW